MAFSEALKIKLRRKAHFSCCLCHSVDVEVHHVIPEAENGPDIEDNAAPLCASCHNIYGANPQKRKFIREARDHWFEVCRNRFKSDPDGLEEIRQLLRERLGNEAVSKYPDQPKEGASFSGELHFELRGDPHQLGAEVWVWHGSRNAAIKLCDTAGWGNLRVLFSPDDRHIIIRDGGSSMGIDLRLFSRAAASRETNFHEDDAASIGDKAEEFVLKQADLDPSPLLHHRYLGCFGWSDDSKAILFRMSGYGHRDGRAYRMDWIGTYDVNTGLVGTDLQIMNPNPITVGDRVNPD